MEGNEFGVPGETLGKTTTTRKSSAELSKMISNEIMKNVEVNECCNFIESDLKKWYKKVQKLNSAKIESGRIISEYKARNKVNAINSESLVQALNELNKYKCELKSSYIAAEKRLKVKKMKYNKIITDYESFWQKTLKEYNSDPIFKQLKIIEQENLLLEKEIQEQEKLISCTKSEYGELEENVWKTFTETTVEFSKFLMQYKQFINSSSTNDKSETEKPVNSKAKFLFFQLESSPFNKKVSSEGNQDPNYTCSIDLSVFDDVIIPPENLESQNLEEEGYSFIQNDGQQLTDSSKEEALEYLNNYRPTQQQITRNNSATVRTAEENESQYFRQQHPETPKQPPEEDRQVSATEKLKQAKPAPGQSEGEEEPPKDVHCEESLSEGSYEKQMTHSRENFDYQYQKTPSVSSDDLPPGGESQNESGNGISKPPNQEKKSDSENNFSSFAGFFSMGDDQGTPKPSIFKLF